MKKLKLNIVIPNCCVKLNFFALIVIFLSPTFLLSDKIDTVDIYKPIFNKVSHCGDFLVNVTDNKAFLLNKDSFQLDVGITDKPILYTQLTKNFTEIYESTFEQGEVNYNFSFRLSVKNKFEDAIAIFAVYDATKLNYNYDSLVYKAEKLNILPGLVSFGSVFINTERELSSKIINKTDKTIEIKSIKLVNGTKFSLFDTPSNYDLFSDEELTIYIHYKPDVDYKFSKELDFDTLIVETNCLRYSLSINGMGVKSEIIVDDIDFGAIEINSQACYDESYNPNYGRGVRISNPGSGKLFITGHYELDGNSPFLVKESSFPHIENLEINPGNETFLQGICFAPTIPGEFYEPLIFKNSAQGPDSICYMRGIAYLPGPYISSVNFGRLRVGDSKKGEVIIRNSGKVPVEINSVDLNSENGEFKILMNESYPEFSELTPATVYPDLPEFSGKLKEISLIVEFTPKFEYNREIKLTPVFSTNSGISQGSVFNYAKGFGYLPAVSAKGYTYQNLVLVNEQHPDTGRVIIESSSWSADLYLKEIEIIPEGNTNPDEFIFLSNLPKDTILSINNPLILPVLFVPQNAGDRIINLRIITDAYRGKENSKWDTIYIQLKGESFNKVLSIENLLFDSVYQCDLSRAYLKVKNISDTTEAFITELKILSGDSKAFTLKTDSIMNNFVILQPNDSIFIEVIFEPLNYDKSDYELFVRIFSDVDTSTGMIKATTKKYNAEISLPVIDEITPGSILLYNPPKSHSPNFDIEADFSKVEHAIINNFNLKLKYKKSEVKFANQINRGNLTSNWYELNAVEYDFDDVYSILEITGKGDYDIAGLKNILCKPVFMVLLGDTNKIEIKIQSLSLGDADKCINQILNNGELIMSYCGDEVRKIILSNNFFDIKNESANPVNESFTTIQYSVAFSTYTKIEVFNSYGESVQKIEDGYLSQGNYSRLLKTSELSNGPYYIKMISGPFAKTIKIMILK